MDYKQLLLLSVVGLCLLVNTGCPAVIVGAAAGVGVGAGTVAYVGGELKSTEDASLDQAWGATQTAMGDLGFAITERRKDVFNAELNARGVEVKKIRIALKKISDNSTEFKIRVGVFGDEAKSRQILQTIKQRL
jgi:hypothetical protein